MREYRTSLQKRRHRSRVLTERYWSDPEFRLAKINRDRARRGAPLIASLDEVARVWSRQPRSNADGL